MDLSQLVFLTLLFLVAFLYSSVGHGGASGYLALMGLWHFTPEVMRPTALIMNCIVSLMAFVQYSGGRALNKKLFVWLVAGSIPAAFFGALLTVDAGLYKKLLAVLLFFPALRLFGVFGKPPAEVRAFRPPIAFVAGLLIGLLSGMIGIGGGIILSPLILLFRWADIKQTALISSLFIFFNSVAGLVGLASTGLAFAPAIFVWVTVAVSGGIAGAWLGSRKIQNEPLKKILGIVLLIASVKLFAEQNG